MIGMLLFGYLFRTLGKEKRRPVTAPKMPTQVPADEEAPDLFEEIAVVIATSVHLYVSALTDRASALAQAAPESGLALNLVGCML